MKPPRGFGRGDPRTRPAIAPVAAFDLWVPHRRFMKRVNSPRQEALMRARSRFVSHPTLAISQPSHPIPTGWRAVALACMVSAATAGCSSLWPGGSDDKGEESRLQELLTVPKPPELIRDAAVPYGLQPMPVEGVAVVNGLSDTGGPPDPSPFRDQLIEELKHEKIRDPNLILESDKTALARIRTIIPPGARRGDPLDLSVLSPPESRASDLQGGWVMNTRLRQQQLIRKQIRQSDVKATGIGPVLTRAAHNPEPDPALRMEGIVLAGGRVQVDRKLGLLLSPKYKHVKISADLEAAINRRFFFFDGTTRRGIAKAIEDDFIELEAHPRYRRNEHRMIEVVRSISGRPENATSPARLAALAERLLEPGTASDAALQLEGIGDTAIPTLLRGLESANPEVRFYAAESLAFLNREESIRPLAAAARETPAFRYSALAALQGFDNPRVVDALSELLDEPSLETRYGAFCTLRRRADGRPGLREEAIGDAYRLYRIPSKARPAVVVSLRETAEIVLFGNVAPPEIPEFLFGPGGIMVKPDAQSPGQLRISRFRPGHEDRRATVTRRVDDLLRGVAAVDGGYGHAVEILRVAKAAGHLADQLAFDPLPEPMRTYHREPAGERQADAESGRDRETPDRD